MKYLKKFNEELNAMTYRKVAKKLKDLGHVNRALRVSEHEKIISKRVDDKKWTDMIEKFSKWGKAKLQFNTVGKSPKKVFEGEFYLLLNYDDYSTEDLEYDKSKGGDFDFTIQFSIGLIPVNQEVKDLCDKYFPDPESSNGFYWGLWVNIDYKVEDERIKFVGIKINPYDEGLTLPATIMDRRGALLLKKILKAAFDENQDYPSGYTDIPNMHDKLFKSYCQDLEMLSDYNFSMDRVLNDIESVPHNTLFKD